MGAAGLENKGGRLRAWWSPAVLRRRRLKGNRTTDPRDAAALDLGARRLGHAEDFHNLSPSFGLVGVIGSRSGTACENMNHRRRDAR